MAGSKEISSFAAVDIGRKDTKSARQGKPGSGLRRIYPAGGR